MIFSFRDGGWSEERALEDLVPWECHRDSDGGVWLANQNGVHHLRADGSRHSIPFTPNDPIRLVRVNSGIHLLRRSNVDVLQEDGGITPVLTGSFAAGEKPAVVCPKDALAHSNWYGAESWLRFDGLAWSHVPDAGLPPQGATYVFAIPDGHYYLGRTGQPGESCIYRGER